MLQIILKNIAIDPEASEIEKLRSNYHVTEKGSVAIYTVFDTVTQLIKDASE
jgi:hypothetical protein